MFSRFVTLLPLAALAAVVTATPVNSCNSGSLYCCDQKFSNPMDFKGKDDPLSLIGVLVGLGVNAGITCDPITILGLLDNGAQCTQQTACCSKVEQNGLVNIACSPVAVPL